MNYLQKIKMNTALLMNKLKRYWPACLWLVFCFSYLSYAVGFDNYFAQLPWEILASSCAIAAVPLLNWYIATNPVNDYDASKDEAIIANAMLDPVTPTPKTHLQEIPIEGLFEGLWRLFTERKTA